MKLQFLWMFFTFMFISDSSNGQQLDSLSFEIASGPFATTYSQVFGNDTNYQASYFESDGIYYITLQMGHSDYDTIEFVQFQFLIDDTTDLNLTADTNLTSEVRVLYFFSDDINDYDLLPVLISQSGTVDISYIRFYEDRFTLDIEGIFELGMSEYIGALAQYSFEGIFSNKGNNFDHD